MYGEGISRTGELLDLGIKAGVIEKAGSWFSYASQRVGQGRENAKQFLREHPDVANAVEAKVREQSGIVANALMIAPTDDDDTEAAE
jgi:recombination protein RecA